MASLRIELPEATFTKLEAKAMGETPASLAQQVVEQSLKPAEASVADKLRSIRGILHTRAGTRSRTRGYLKGFGQ
jgi:hypothetical protein